ncbi:MAG: CarD family transcriptional regulator, partial [Planctomycetota bacterium]|jgi:transcription-repair coupling factor (superfamily II helicase)
MELGQDKTVVELVRRLKAGKESGGVVKVAGTWGSFAPLLAAHIRKEVNRPILYVSPHISDAEKIIDDLRTFGCERVESLPAWEGEEDIADATDEIRAERLRVVSSVSNPAGGGDRSPLVISASVQALCQPIPKPEALEESSLRLQRHKALSPEQVGGWLVDNGFESVERIDLPGQFARRGGIVDIYSPLVSGKVTAEAGGGKSSSACGEAIRVEFFGDTIESIRSINLDTQLSSEQIEKVNIISAVCGSEKKNRSLFLNILPKETFILFEEPADIEDVAKVYLERVEDVAGLYSWRQIHKGSGRFTQLHICKFATAAPDEFLKVDVRSVQQFQQSGTSLWAKHKESLEQLVRRAAEGRKVYLYCESSAEIKRVGEIIRQTEKEVPANFKLRQGFINHGFILNSLDTIVISHHELFGQYSLRRRERPARATLPIDTLEDLRIGDYVVHISYGIGKFLGVQTIEERGGKAEYLSIQYADGEKIHVSVSNIILVQKYIGTSPKRPKLNRLGSKRWAKQKEKAARSVRQLAGELLEVQAKRISTGGIAYSKDSAWQTEFEESFAYEETADQITAAEQIKRDMQQPVPMDRLLCGDVGYGKTELMMRAAFKAVEGGRQVAVLVPTTVLCVQHGRTFRERFADFPISIEMLNRFKTAKQAGDIISGLKKGTVDIVIGTHRLLSDDIGFNDLGSRQFGLMLMCLR